MNYVDEESKFTMLQGLSHVNNTYHTPAPSYNIIVFFVGVFFSLVCVSKMNVLSLRDFKVFL